MQTAHFAPSPQHVKQIFGFLKITTCCSDACWHVSSWPKEYQHSLVKIYFWSSRCARITTEEFYMLYRLSVYNSYLLRFMWNFPSFSWLGVWSHLAETVERAWLITSAGTDSMSRKGTASVSSSGTEPSQAITCIREVASSNIGWHNDYSAWKFVVFCHSTQKSTCYLDRSTWTPVQKVSV
jgi:hypothetical protein